MQAEPDANLHPQHSSTSMKRKKKKRKKSATTAILNASSDDGDNYDAILQSKLSTKKKLSLKNTCKQTPWYDTNELIQTGRELLLSLKLFPSHHRHQQQQEPATTPAGLTPDEHAQLQLAFRRVAVWRGHSPRGRLSHAVDMTAGLASLLLNDAERTTCLNKNTCNNPYQLRNSYSTLLLRSVNGLADTYRHQRKSSLLSVSHCCAQAGLPLWIVDIRHDASHNDLPSLGLCRIGAIESLRFWKTRYWDTLESKVWGKKNEIGALDAVKEKDNVGICSYALDCLVRYQQAALSEAKERELSKRKQKIRVTISGKRQMKQNDEFNKVDKETEDLLLLLPDDSKAVARKQKRDTQTASSNNPFAILHDDKPKKKRKSQDKSEQKNGPGKDPVESEPSSATIDNTATTNTSQASSRDCAAEFVREIPMDIAMSEALKFLVWGIGGDDLHITQGPALITGLSALSTTIDANDAFNNFRPIYDPLLIAMTNAYPGFVPALVVHLLDSILCLDSVRGSHCNEASTFDSHAKTDGELYLQQISCNIQYLSMWIRYIFSREFHMHFNRLAAIYVEEEKSVVITSETGKKCEFKSHPIDLKKKGRKNWTQQQLNFMQGSLQYTIFQNLGVPLNSICDRLVTHRHRYSRDSVASELLHFFEDIIGDNRVAFMGLVRQTEVDGQKDDDCVPVSEVEQKTTSAEAANDLLTKNAMSLEDMEAFLNGAKKPEDEIADETSNTAGKEINTDAKRSTIKAWNTVDIKPWTLCKSWDSCAIGSVAGYPA